MGPCVRRDDVEMMCHTLTALIRISQIVTVLQNLTATKWPRFPYRTAGNLTVPRALVKVAGTSIAAFQAEEPKKRRVHAAVPGCFLIGPFQWICN